MIRTENDLWDGILPVVAAGLSGYPEVRVIRSYQPSPQSPGDVPRVVLYRVSSRRYGCQGKRTETRDGILYETDIWRMEDTFQAAAVVNRAATDDGYTARDLVDALAGYLHSQTALDALAKMGMGILRTIDMVETPYEDGANTFRISVSMKFTVTYKQEQEREVSRVTRVVSGIHRV